MQRDEDLCDGQTAVLRNLQEAAAAFGGGKSTSFKIYFLQQCQHVMRSGAW